MDIFPFWHFSPFFSSSSSMMHFYNFIKKSKKILFDYIKKETWSVDNGLSLIVKCRKWKEGVSVNHSSENLLQSAENLKVSRDKRLKADCVLTDTNGMGLCNVFLINQQKSPKKGACLVLGLCLCSACPKLILGTQTHH